MALRLTLKGQSREAELRREAGGAGGGAKSAQELGAGRAADLAACSPGRRQCVAEPSSRQAAPAGAPPAGGGGEGAGRPAR